MSSARECSKCGRLYVAVRTAAEACPACGSALTSLELPNGVYELVSSAEYELVSSAERVFPSSPASQSAGETSDPHDLGYGESHGYGPSHGGPTGPGDAPATPADEAHR